MQIRFDGSPSHEPRLIEVEDDEGRGIKVGEWRQDGKDWLLVIPYDQDLRSVVAHVLSDIDYFLERNDHDPEAFAEQHLPNLADRLRFARNPMALHRCQKGEPCGECGRPLDCVCHPAHVIEVIFDEERTKMPGSIGEKLDQIIAEASAFSEYSVQTDDAFRLIAKLAKDIDDQLEDRLCPSQDANGECRPLNEVISHSEDLEQRLARALRVQNAIRQERSYAERGRERYRERLDHVQAQLSALHGEFRTAAARLKFVANWLTNTYACASNADATAARGYAAAAKEVLDKGLDWLVERNRNRGRGVMESTAASKTAGAGSSPAARATRGAAEMLGAQPIQNDMDFCMLCTSGIMGCAYDGMDRERIWENITQLLAELARSEEAVENCNTQRVILNLMWHYRKVEE